MEESSEVWEAAPTVCAVVICFASFIGSTDGLAFEHQREVCSVSGEVMLSSQATQPLSVPLQGGFRFLPFPIPTSSLSALRLSTSSEERYGLTLFRWTDMTR
jgi:hypothetical protein